MLYTNRNKSFKHHVHPVLQNRIRLFLLMEGIMLTIVLWNILEGYISIPLALIGAAIGAVVGFFSSRMFHLSWSKNGKQIVGQIDRTGWIILVIYTLYGSIRLFLFESVIHTEYPILAITLVFVSSELIFRVLGLRGKILRILKEERVLV